MNKKQITLLPMKSLTKYILFVFCILFPCGYLSSADNLIFKHFNMENGLSQSTVRCIVQDEYGFMWFGTKDGLNRFDGLNFKIYRHIPNDPSSIGSNNIFSLCVGENGTIWVGTDAGLYQYNAESDGFRYLELKSQDNTQINKEVNDIKIDNNRNLWIAGGPQGIFRYNMQKEELFHFEIPSGRVVHSKCIDIDDKGYIWVGTLQNGLYFYNFNQNSFDKWQTTGKELGSYRINSLLCSNDRMYIGTAEEGLLVMVNNNNVQPVVLEKQPKHLSYSYVHCIYRKTSTEILIGTEGGLCLYNEITKQPVYYTHQMGNLRSISDNAIYSLYKDKEQGVWIGTYFDGINYLPYQFSPFTQYYPQQDGVSIKGERIREICQDKNGLIWIGSEDNGLSCFNPSTQKMIEFPIHKNSEFSSSKNIHGLTCDDNYLWIGYYNGGIDRYELSTGKIEHISLSDLLGHKVNEDIFSLYHSQADNTLWIGTVRGVYRYNIRENELNPESELGIIFVHDIKQDSKGNLWIATLNSGAFCYNPQTKKTIQYTYEDNNITTISSDKILSISITSLQAIWFTTEGGGICRYNEETDDFTRISEENGLPNNVVYKIVEDIDKNLWFGTNRGLVRMNPSTQNIQVYMNSDGLISNQFNYKSGFIDKNGTLYFGTVKGMIAFNPRTFVENNYKPSVALTSFSIFNKEVKPGDDSPLKQSINTTGSITLNHTQSTISFEFVALSFATSEQNKYAYKMEGIDKDWIILDRSNRVSYSNLPPGRYTFRMKGANSYDIWSDSEKTVDIYIRPPFYLSNVAYALYLVLIVVGIYLLYILQQRRFTKKHKQEIREIEQEKEKEAVKAKIDFFTNITHEIRTPLTLISSPLEYLLENEKLDGDTRDNLNIMQQNTNRLLQLSNQLLDFQRVENLGFQLNFNNTDISQLVSDTFRRFKPAFEEKSMQTSLTIPSKIIYAKIDVEAVVKIISNLLNNALKYAESYVAVELKLSEEKTEMFSIQVESDGHLIEDSLKEKIFEPFYQIKENTKEHPAKGSGLGLSLAKKLAELHEGNLFHEISEKNMNRFVLLIPLNSDKETAEEINEPLIGSTQIINEKNFLENQSRKMSNILIVEDNKDLLDFLSKRLETEFQVYKSVNGNEALQKLESIDPDIIICDLMMPELDGFGLLQELKSNYRYSHIPVIILTAKNNLNSKIQSLEYGADAYIEKPFSFTYLRAQIINLIEKRKEVKRLFSLYPVSSFDLIISNNTDEEFLAKANQIIEKNIDNPELNIDLLSAELGLSKSTLNRKFRGISELSPNEYIRVYRLKKAVIYLKSGKYRINEVAFLTGFSTSSYFAKCFQKQFGVLPKEYATAEHKEEK